MSTSYIIPFTAFILVQFHIFLYLVSLPSPYCSAFAFHFTSSMQCRIWYPMSDAARKAIELSREVCGCDSPLSTVEGPTSKPLFIPQPTVVRQPKCQWVRSYLQACFLCPLSSWGNRARKKVLCVRTERGFSRLGRKSLLWQWFVKRTNWTSPLFFPLPPLLLLFFFLFFLVLLRQGFYDNRAQSHWVWLTFSSLLFSTYKITHPMSYHFAFNQILLPHRICLFALVQELTPCMDTTFTSSQY